MPIPLLTHDHYIRSHMYFPWADVESNFWLSCCFGLYRMRNFESGVLVVQSLSHSEEAIIRDTAKLVGYNNVYLSQLELQ